MKRNTLKFILGLSLIVTGLTLIVVYDGRYWPIEAGTIAVGAVFMIPFPLRWTV